jgi:hypothetical protein
MFIPIKEYLQLCKKILGDSAREIQNDNNAMCSNGI